MKYICKVCGYPELTWPPKDDTICPCCCTQFGLDDDYLTHEELRAKWIASGAQWWSKYTPSPVNWSPFSQLSNIGYVLTHDDIKAIFMAKVKGTAMVNYSHCLPSETPVASNTKFNTARTSYALAA